MRTGLSYLRVIIFIAIAFFLLEFVIDSGTEWAIVKYPIIWAVLSMLLLFAVAIELVSEALKSILFKSLKPDAQKRFLDSEKLARENQFRGIKNWYNKLLDSKPLEKEDDIVLDHNYDGIKELDNTLPPWWVYMFYATIIFAVVYLVRYEIFGDTNQAEEYEIAVAEAKYQIAEYKKTAKDLVDVNTVELLTESSDLSAGKNIFTTNCIPCHKADGGGGIGPNLTDQNWILGGGIKNVFNTISEGGRSGKGMISWKTELKPLERAQVASYVLSFQGTTPAEPKAAEGDIWVNPDAPKTDAILEETEAVIDSTAIDVIINN